MISAKNYDEQNELEARLPSDSQSIRSNIIDTKFSCDEHEPGYYADVENECQVKLKIFFDKIIFHYFILLFFKFIFLDFSQMFGRSKQCFFIHLPPTNNFQSKGFGLCLER